LYYYSEILCWFAAKIVLTKIQKETDRVNIDFLEFVKEYYENQGIQFLMFSAPYKNLEQTDYCFRKQIFPEYRYENLNHITEKQLTPGILCHVEDEFRLYYTLYKVPVEFKSVFSADLIVIGPLLFSPVTSGFLHTFMEENQISLEMQIEVREFLNRIPMPGSFDNWSLTATLLFSKLTGKRPESMTILRKDAQDYHLSYSGYASALKPEVALATVEERYRIETELITAVSAGNVEQASEAHLHFRRYRLMPRTADPVRNAKNMLIILNTLLRKGAQLGHVHPLHIDSLSTQIALQIESLTSVTALDSYGLTMVRKYCLLVKNYSRKNYSSLIQTCLDYIDFHYMEDLSLDLMAKLCSVTNTYLSSLFKKEVSMTLTDYINSTRIRQSLALLNTTSLSIQEIALQCGFSDSNYFTRTFKKFQGQSPKGYRETIRRSQNP